MNKTEIGERKNKEITEWLRRPIAKGDKVNVDVPYTKNETVKVGGRNTIRPVHANATSYGTVIEVGEDDKLGTIYQVRTESFSKPFNACGVPDGWTGPGGRYGDEWYIAAWVTPDTSHIGADPFVDAPDIRFYNKNIECVLMQANYGKRTYDFMEPEYDKLNSGTSIGKTYGGVDFNPYVTDKNGKRRHYQRDLVWTQQQKQDLIQTVYSGGEIGKFVFRYNPWSSIERQAAECGHGFNWDCVDGKQRFHALLEFVQNKFPDVYGYYYRDLSHRAQRRFLNYGKLSFGELGEGTTDRQTIMAFLHVNVKGTPVSAEHIQTVKDINV